MKKIDHTHVGKHRYGFPLKHRVLRRVPVLPLPHPPPKGSSKPDDSLSDPHERPHECDPHDALAPVRSVDSVGSVTGAATTGATGAVSETGTDHEPVPAVWAVWAGVESGAVQRWDLGRVGCKEKGMVLIALVA